MYRRTALIALGIAGLSLCGVLLAQKPFREWPGIEYDNFELPSDFQQKAEWTRARLRYPDIYGYPDTNLVMRGGRPFPGYWTMDYPRSDRHLLEGVRRLTRIESKSVEQVVSLDGTDDMYNYPTLYAVEVGHWKLKESDAQQLREFLLRGGFLMVDDFHGERAADHDQGINEWANFTEGIGMVLPGRPIEDIPNNDPIFHTIYDLSERFQVPGAQYFETGITYEKGPSGKVPHWRGIRDDKGRIVVAICHNMHLGDAWEWADSPEYPEKFAAMAFRVGLNYIMYGMTH